MTKQHLEDLERLLLKAGGVPVAVQFPRPKIEVEWAKTGNAMGRRSSHINEDPGGEGQRSLAISTTVFNKLSELTWANVQSSHQGEESRVLKSPCRALFLPCQVADEQSLSPDHRKITCESSSEY
jgi:hypothetical protein